MYTKREKRALSVILVLMMILSMVPVSAMAAQTVDREYTVTNSDGKDYGGLTIKKSAAGPLNSDGSGYGGTGDVYFDVKLEVTDSYRNEDIFEEASYGFYQDGGGNNMIPAYMTEEEALADSKKANAVEFRFVDGSNTNVIYTKTVWTTVNGTCFAVFDCNGDSIKNQTSDAVQKDGVYVYIDISTDSKIVEMFYGKRAISVEDTVAEAFVFVGLLEGNDGMASENGGVVSWDLSSENGNSYTLTYRVKMTKSDFGSYPLNPAKIKYDDYSGVDGKPVRVLDKESNEPIVDIRCIQTSVTVYHYLTVKVTKLENGETVVETEGPALLPGSPETITGVFVGKQFTAEPLDGYTLDTEADNTLTIASLQKSGNEIKIYYIAERDDRALVPYSVEYIFKTNTYELVNGKYEFTPGTELPVPGDSGEMRDGEVYAAQHHADYLAENSPWKDNEPVIESSSGDLSIKVGSGGNNKVQILYERTVDDREAAELKVNHHYRSITVPGVFSDGSVTEKQTVYIGETHAVAIQPSYKDGVYAFDSVTSGTFADGSVTVSIDKSSTVVDIYYTRDLRVTTGASVRHNYVTWEWVINEYGDAQLTVADTVKEAGTIIEETVYVGGSATTAEAAKDGFVPRSSNVCVINNLSENASDNVIELWYDSIPGELDSAWGQVIHVYETVVTYVETNPSSDLYGRVTTRIDANPNLTIEEFVITGVEGEWFDATERVTDGFTRVDTNDLRVYLSQNGTVLKLTYRNAASELVDAEISVKPVYRDFKRQINETGETIDVLVATDETAETVTYPLEGEYLYIGMFFTAQPGGFGRDGYDFNGEYTSSANQYSDVLLDASDNGTITLYFDKINDVRTNADVIVKHHYAYCTWNTAEGTWNPALTETVTEETVSRYVNSFYPITTREIYKNLADITANINYEVDSISVNGTAGIPDNMTMQVAEGENTIDVYYAYSEPAPAAATYLVNHYYKTTDWNGDVINSEALNRQEGSSNAGATFEAVPDYVNGLWDETHIVSRMFNGNTVGSSVVTLEAGENVFDFYYEKQIDSRVGTTLAIVHNYYLEGSDEPEDTVTVFYSDDREYTQWTWIGAEVAASLKYTSGKTGYLYAFRDASYIDSAGYTDEGHAFGLSPQNELILQVVTMDNCQNKTITINYERSLGMTGYTVIHRYYSDNTLAGEFDTGLITGKVGDTVTVSADGTGDVTLLTIYGNPQQAYTFTGASPESLVLSADETENTIVIRYDRTTAPPVPPPTPEPEPEPEPTPPPQTTPDQTDGQDEEIELFDEPTILSDFPPEVYIEVPADDIIILDEAAPLGDLPQTSSGYKPLVLAGLLTMLGIIGLSHGVRKAGDDAS